MNPQGSPPSLPGGPLYVPGAIPPSIKKSDGAAERGSQESTLETPSPVDGLATNPSAANRLCCVASREESSRQPSPMVKQENPVNYGRQTPSGENKKGKPTSRPSSGGIQRYFSKPSTSAPLTPAVGEKNPAETRWQPRGPAEETTQMLPNISLPDISLVEEDKPTGPTPPGEAIRSLDLPVGKTISSVVQEHPTGTPPCSRQDSGNVMFSPARGNVELPTPEAGACDDSIYFTPELYDEAEPGNTCPMSPWDDAEIPFETSSSFPELETEDGAAGTGGPNPVDPAHIQLVAKASGGWPGALPSREQDRGVPGAAQDGSSTGEVRQESDKKKNRLSRSRNKGPKVQRIYKRRIRKPSSQRGDCAEKQVCLLQWSENSFTSFNYQTLNVGLDSVAPERISSFLATRRLNE